MSVFIYTTACDTYSVTSLPLGYSEPQRKMKCIVGKQHTSAVGAILGLAGGKPTASVNATTGRSTSSMAEVADDEVCFAASHSQYY